ncbi:helix-turn-helix domain-containing protein [Kineosporia sp. J2-2]|uniref:Helix-turn-helix domain-containing protein n=1 Tax=Kineosporia corallincola TaxID=2835133 RepID=A0ABS5TN33_9ACTN|nr:helix-turn-helix transcriptional regulator [Kineosporia corallincola]MBT0771478.1 helix-turn-helix domain-containing protein [Kineosporia corallincola]
MGVKQEVRQEVKEFLTSRRARVTPDQAGLAGGSNRRVPGLRRTEVALLAGVSVEYYSKLERGDLTGASEAVLAAIADALRLDEAERAHLFDLARACAGPAARSRRRAPAAAVRPAVRWALDNITGGPAFVRNGRLDVLAENALFRGLYWDAYQLRERPLNLARLTFLHRELAERYYPQWDVSADINVAILRTEAGRNPYDRDLQDLIGELSTRSDDFRVRWGAHNVRHHANGQKHFIHPVVGDLHMSYEAMEPMDEPGLNFLIYAAEPGSPSEASLRLLASWVATQEQGAREPGVPRSRD